MTGVKRHWLAFSIGLVGLLLCGHLLLLETGGNIRSCLGQSQPVDHSPLFDCRIALELDPLKAYGLSLALVGLAYWLSLMVLLLGQLMRPGSSVYRLGLRYLSLLAAFIAVGLLVWQFRGSSKLCPLCLADAILAVAAAACLFRCHVQVKHLVTAWPAYLISTLLAGVASVGVYLALHRPAAAELTPERFYELLSQQIAPRYLDEMAPCGFPEDTVPLSELPSFFTEKDHLVGPADAPLQLTVLFDPSCPACGYLNRQLNQIREAFAPEAGEPEIIAIRYIPLMLYEATLPTTQALWLLRGQPGFNQLKDRLSQEDFKPLTTQQQLRAVLDELGLDADSLLRQIEAGAGRQEIIDTTLATYDAGIDSLPRLFINGKPMRQSRRNRTADCLAQTLLGEIKQDPTPKTTETEPSRPIAE